MVSAPTLTSRPTRCAVVRQDRLSLQSTTSFSRKYARGPGLRAPLAAGEWNTDAEVPPTEARLPPPLWDHEGSRLPSTRVRVLRRPGRRARVRTVRTALATRLPQPLRPSAVIGEDQWRRGRSGGPGLVRPCSSGDPRWTAARHVGRLPWVRAAIFPYCVSITSNPRSGGVISLITLFCSVCLKSQRITYIFNANVIRHQTIHTLSCYRSFSLHGWN